MYTGTIPDCHVAGSRRAIKSTTPSTKHKAEPSPSTKQSHTKHKAEPSPAISHQLPTYLSAIRTQAPITITKHVNTEQKHKHPSPITNHVTTSTHICLYSTFCRFWCLSFNFIFVFLLLLFLVSPPR